MTIAPFSLAVERERGGGCVRRGGREWVVVCERDSAWEGERDREREGGSVCE